MPAGRMYKYTKPKTKSTASVAKIARKAARQVISSKSETKAVGKQLPGSPTVPAQGLTHNKVFYLPSLLATSQGVQDPNDYTVNTARIGDEILLTNLNIRFMLSAFQPNVTYKLCLFWYTAGTTLSDAVVYFTQGTKLLDRYNTEQIAIIDQKIVTPNIGALPADDANPRRTRLVTLNGNWKMKKIRYNEQSTVPRFKDIGCICVAYDSINTTQVIQIAECVYDYKLKFKDL